MKKKGRFLFCITIYLMIMCQLSQIIVYADDIMDQAKSILENYYIGNIPDSALKATSMEEMLEYLEDPYTQYLTDGSYEKMIDSLNMKFIGIGVYIEMVEKGAKVTNVMLNSPAMDSGIKEGDIIFMADGYTLSGLSLGKAMSLINGIEGISVNLKVERNKSIMDFTTIPRQIPYPTVTSELLDNHIGYIRIISFGDITEKEFKDKVEKLNTFNVSSFIIDLRNNPGGYLGSMLEIADYFIGRNIAFVIEDKINKKYRVETYGNHERINKPVVFLLNEFSASAAEVLLASVQDYDKALLVGESTYGKGVAQNIFRLSDGSVLKTTIYRFYSPKGRSIDNIGISPNIKINEFDPLIVAELLLGDSKYDSNKDEYIRVIINNKSYDINQSKIITKELWEAYKSILNIATSLEMQYNTWNYDKKVDRLPYLKFMEMPKVNYYVGDRITFKLSAPEYNNRIEYRAILWEESTNLYHDLWNTSDRYYKSWKPKGRDVFTISFPAVKPGNYRIKIFCKRSGVQNNNTALKGMNCDSYTAEIPFVINPS